MISAAPLALTATLMGWGTPAIPAETPAAEAPPAEAPPAAEQPAPGQAAADARQFLQRFANYPTPVPPPVIYVESSGTEERWYGWQLLLADLGSYALIMVKSPPAVGIGIGGLVLGAPVLHAANHNYGTAVASFAVRGGVALLVAALLSDPPPCPMGDTGCSVDRLGGELIGLGLAAGLLVGGMVFAIVDDTALAHVKVPRKLPAGLSPIVAPRAGGVSLGLGASF